VICFHEIGANFECGVVSIRFFFASAKKEVEDVDEVKKEVREKALTTPARGTETSVPGATTLEGGIWRLGAVAILCLQ
jgi:hypothetical protein